MTYETIDLLTSTPNSLPWKAKLTLEEVLEVSCGKCESIFISEQTLSDHKKTDNEKEIFIKTLKLAHQSNKLQLLQFTTAQLKPKNQNFLIILPNHTTSCVLNMVQI